MKTTTTTIMQFLFLLAAFTVANAGDATCLAGTGLNGTAAKTNDECTARGITEVLCQTEGNDEACQWAAAVCTTANTCKTATDTEGVCGEANVADEDNKVCDDSNDNTEGDKCVAGECAGTPIACAAVDNATAAGDKVAGCTYTCDNTFVVKGDLTASFTCEPECAAKPNKTVTGNTTDGCVYACKDGFEAAVAAEGEDAVDIQADGACVAVETDKTDDKESKEDDDKKDDESSGAVAGVLVASVAAIATLL